MDEARVGMSPYTYVHTQAFLCTPVNVHTCHSDWKTETNTGTIKCQPTVMIISEHMHTVTVLCIHDAASLDRGSI